jgi:hypothetical protein
MQELHDQIRPQLEANGTRTLRGPHLTALIEDWFAGRAHQVAAASVPDNPPPGNDEAPREAA